MHATTAGGTHYAAGGSPPAASLSGEKESMNQNTQSDLGKLVLRLVLGVLVLLHGIAKLSGVLAGIEGMVAAHGLLADAVIGPETLFALAANDPGPHLLRTLD
jgi:hypothetical protein